MLKKLNLINRRQIASEIIRTAGLNAKFKFLAKDFTTHSKGTQDFVSQVDEDTEAFIRNELSSKFPEDNILGEEGGGQLGEKTWIIDPIDGTSNFVRGMAPWCISAALAVDNKVVIGIIYDPMLDEMFTCHEGGGSSLNGTCLKVTNTRDPHKAILGISFNFQNSKDCVSEVVDTLISNGTSFRMSGSGALSLAYCAAGRIDGFWEAFMKPWDASAGLALVSEAGGLICDYGANEGFLNGNPVLASNPHLAEYFEKVTNSQIKQPIEEDSSEL